MNQSLIEFIVKNAPILREVGVLSLSIEGAAFTLAPREPEAMPDLDPEPEVEHPNALGDPFTYPGGKAR